MMLINDDGKVIGCKEISQFKALSNDRLKILKYLGRRPAYAIEIAKEIGLPPQITYYHIKVLERAGMIKFVDYEEKNGGVAKRYLAKAQSFALVVDDKGWKDSASPSKEAPVILERFFENGVFNGLMVVGSPDPHGKHRARGSELGMLELAMLFGRYAAPVFPMYKLDTQTTERDRTGNLVLAGGPKVNILVAEVNGKLPIRFTSDNAELYSTITSKAYSGNIGVVELIKSPFDSSKKILVIGGLNQNGTRAAVLALVKHSKEFEKMTRVVEGFDEDGDGLVDTIEFLE
ncbi:MAG: helix-turn-helix domain-containing protein [Candidatus Micrarchaeota archaeon]